MTSCQVIIKLRVKMSKSEADTNDCRKPEREAGGSRGGVVRCSRQRVGSKDTKGRRK